VSVPHEAPKPKAEVRLTAHVPVHLAMQVQRLAEAGDRSISREVTRALRAHVRRQPPPERRGADSAPEAEPRQHGGKAAA
jgi:hypothetical protein